MPKGQRHVRGNLSLGLHPTVPRHGLRALVPNYALMSISVRASQLPSDAA